MNQQPQQQEPPALNGDDSTLAAGGIVTPPEAPDFCVPYFSSDTAQIKFEFGYLLVSLIAAVFLVILVDRNIHTPSRPLMFAGLGGFLGGWAFDAKWFYRVTARGKSDQYSEYWQRHKFYWRILIPYVAGLISFSAYLLASSDTLPVVVKDRNSGRAAFGLTFFLGLFTDLMFSRLAKWCESLLPGKASDA